MTANDPAFDPHLTRDLAELDRRLTNIESTSAVIVVTVDAGGLAWDAGNPNYIDPALASAWTELRLTGTPTGDAIYRACRDAGAVYIWKPQAT